MGNSQSLEEAQPSRTSTNEPGPGVLQEADPEAEGEAEGEADSRRPKKFWNNDLLRLYEQFPYPITPPEGWVEYKSDKNGRPFGNKDPSRDLWGGDVKKDQIRRITRGEAAPTETAALPSIRPFLDFSEENRFSKETLKKKLKNNLYLFSRTCGIRVNKDQRKTLNLWIEGARVIYNAALDSVIKGEMPLVLMLPQLETCGQNDSKRFLLPAPTSYGGLTIMRP